MKKIGLRTIKTAISVFLCLMVFILFKMVEFIPGVPSNFAFSWYNPFFAGLATAYSIHASKSASLNQAKIRCVASLIGGIIGILLITFYELCGGAWPNLQAVNLTTLNFVLPYILIALFTIVVIVTGIVLHQQQAIFVAILTFLSVTVNPNINVGQWQWQFGINRILSTIIGVLIALGVNLFRLPHRFHNRNLLFCVGIDGMLVRDSDRFKGYMQYKMNYLNRIKANVTLFTTRTPTTFMPLLEDVKISHPVICMSGAALYDTVEHRYLATETIPKEIAGRIRELLKDNGISPFINQVRENVLFTYSESIDNPGERIYAESKKNAPYCCFIPEPAPEGDVLYFLIVEREELVSKIISLMEENETLKNEISILIYDVFEANQDQNLKYVKIYSKAIEQLAILKEYCQSVNLEIVGVSSSTHSRHLLQNSKYALSVDTMDEEIKKNCIGVVRANDTERIFHEVNKIYHYNLAKYGKK